MGCLWKEELPFLAELGWGCELSYYASSHRGQHRSPSESVSHHSVGIIVMSWCHTWDRRPPDSYDWMKHPSLLHLRPCSSFTPSPCSALTGQQAGATRLAPLLMDPPYRCWMRLTCGSLWTCRCFSPTPWMSQWGTVCWWWRAVACYVATSKSSKSRSKQLCKDAQMWDKWACPGPLNRTGRAPHGLKSSFFVGLGTQGSSFAFCLEFIKLEVLIASAEIWSLGLGIFGR